MAQHPLHRVVIAALLVMAAAAAATIALTFAFADTGPNCPGADPAWLGWCANAPPAQ